MSIVSKEDLLNKQAEAKNTLESFTCRVLVCSGTGCIASGAQKIYDETAKLCENLDWVSVEMQKDVPHVGVVKTGCQGLCELGPLMKIEPYDYQYVHVQVEDCKEIVERTVMEGQPVSRLFYRDHDTACPHPSDIPFLNQQTRIVLENCGNINAESIDEYIAVGGFQAMAKAFFDMSPQDVIDEVTKSGLRGRGGAGFPAGKKWSQVARQKEKVRYVVCNGDEGDPGAFMDRSILEGDPHSVLEAMAIAGYAIGADEGEIYIRAEYPLAIKRLRIAIKEAEEYGCLGDCILGTDFSFRIYIRYGAGAFVCGEETALIHSIEGHRGEPTLKPPFPAVKGLNGKPTNVNNVETWANVPTIILDGADNFASIGTDKSKGTKVFALAGKVNNVGLVEVPMGTTLREIIYDIGGGIKNGRKFKAVQTGGPSGGCLTEKDLDTPIDYDNLVQRGSMMGSGGMIVLDEDDCAVDIARFYLEFTVEESCGKCTPCRIGNKRMLEILNRIVEGEGTLEDLDRLERLAETIKDSALCALGQTAPNPVLSTLHNFRDEYVAHVVDKKCPAGSCKKLVAFEIDKSLCLGCGMCARNCPVEAIKKSDQPGKNPRLMAYEIDTDKCVRCGSCLSVCPAKPKAIQK